STRRDRQYYMHRTATSAGRKTELSAEVLDPLADVAQADAAGHALDGTRVEADAVVAHLQLHAGDAGHEVDLDQTGAGMPFDVGQRFLDDAKQRDRHRVGQRRIAQLLAAD